MRSFTKILIVFGAINAVGLYAVYTDSTPATAQSVKQAVPPVEQTVNIFDVVGTRITSLQKQNQLLIQTIRSSAVGNSHAKSMGMEAILTTSVTVESQFFIDLKQIDPKKVIVEKDYVIVVVPKRAMIVNSRPIGAPTQFDNDSWLFTMNSNTRPDLIRENQRKIDNGLRTQVIDQKEAAYAQARYSLEEMFALPIKAAKLPYHVTVIFQ